MYRTLTLEPFTFTLETDGNGLWSAESKKINVTKITLDYDADRDPNIKRLWGELRVYFDTDTWDTNKDGLIYTDEQFMDDLKGCLEVSGLDDADVSYSEQGMQGRDFVSCDVGEDFITSWNFKQWSESELPGK